MELHKQEEEWIKSNIKQRIPKCGKLRGNWPDLSNWSGTELCEKCMGLMTEHAKTEYDLHIGTDPCDTYGNLKFENNTPGGKFIRMDVDTDKSLVKHLLLNIWRVPKPSWIISIIGENLDKGFEKVNAFQGKLKKFLDSSFSNRDDVWVTSVGLTFGLSGKVGETVTSCQRNIVPIGMHAWGNITKDGKKCIKMNHPIPNDPRNNPNHYCKFSIFPDDGVNTGSSLQSYQYFRVKLEKMMAQHDEEALSIPYVTILYGGWSFVIDGVKRSIEENIPIIVLKGTGGFADVLASVYEFDESPEKKVYAEGQNKWTGTVIDERLREKLQKEIKNITRRDYGEGERLMLECLQKRELITVFNCNNKKTDHESSLLYAVFEALLKSKTQAEKYRLVDFYMPQAILSGNATAAGPEHSSRGQKNNRILELLLWQLLKMDEAECVQFILDYRGLDIVKFLTKEMEGISLLETAEHKKLLELQTMASGEKTSTDDKDMAKVKMAAFKFLFDWAVRNNKTKCCALFWKKGENLLTSALKASSELYKKGSEAENASERKELQEHGSTFKERAIGLITQCYENDKKQTMELMQAQSSDDPDEDHLSLALQEYNRQIFGTDAYKEYIRRVWIGKIQPYRKPTLRWKQSPERGSENPSSEARLEQSPEMELETSFLQPENTSPVARSEPSPETEEMKEKSRELLSLLTSPKMKFMLNLMLYIAFLALFGYVLLVELRDEGPFLELAVAIWWFSFVVEEIRQFHVIRNKDNTRRERFVKRVKYFFGNYWNILDIICLSMFFFGALSIVVAHADRTNKNAYDAGILILSVNWMFFTWRILQHLAISNSLGPVLEMILQMIFNLLPFLVIMGVFILAQGLAAQAILYPRSVPSFDLFFNSLKKSFWNMFGELFFDVIEASEVRGECTTNPKLYGNDTMEQCPSWLGSYAVPFIMALYMLLMNVLLLNIIIAKFNYTFTKIHSETEWLAAWHQARVTLENYQGKLPPPFTLLHPIYILIKKLMELCKKKPTNDVKGSQNSMNKTDPKQDQIRKMLAWERRMADNYLATLKHQSASKITHKEETRQLKLEEGGGSTVEKQLSRILGAMDELKTELASVKPKIK